MRVDTATVLRRPQAQTVHVAIELSERGQEMLSILNRLFKDSHGGTEEQPSDQANRHTLASSAAG